MVGRGYPTGVFGKKNSPLISPGHLSVELSGLPCRKCADCLRIRAARWRNRAMTEIGRSNRTWFCTFTMSPYWQHRVFIESMASKVESGWLSSDFDDAGKEFFLRCHGGLSLMTKFWKNLRKPQRKLGELPVRLKYIVVAEEHISGLPHYHALVHEVAGSITYRRLQSRWSKYGFFSAKLVEESEDLSKFKAARYVTKYIAKSNLCRVRASQKYGSDVPALALPVEFGWAGDDESLSLSFTPRKKEVSNAYILWP